MTDSQGVWFLSKTVSGSKHFMRTPPAIAFDQVVIDQAQWHQCQYVQVTDRETGDIYKTGLHMFQEKGVPVVRGFGKQVALPFAY